MIIDMNLKKTVAFSSEWFKGFLEYFQVQKDEIKRCATTYNIESVKI